MWLCCVLIYFFLFLPCRFNFEDETPTTNFDTFPAAILTVFQVKVNSTVLSSLVFCFYNGIGHGVSPHRSLLERTGMQSCIMGSNHRGEFKGGCSPPFISSFSLSLETVSCPILVDGFIIMVVGGSERINHWFTATVNVYSVFISCLIFSWDCK